VSSVATDSKPVVVVSSDTHPGIWWPQYVTQLDSTYRATINAPTELAGGRHYVYRMVDRTYSQCVDIATVAWQACAQNSIR
jgi:hypothetical protein